MITSQALTRIGRLYRDRYFLFKAALEEGKDQYDVDDVEELDMLRAVVKRWAQSTAAEQAFSPSERGEIIGVSEHPEYSRPEQLLDAEEACMRWARAVFATETVGDNELRKKPEAKKPTANETESNLADIEAETPPLDTKSIEWIAAREKNQNKFKNLSETAFSRTPKWSA